MLKIKILIADNNDDQIKIYKTYFNKFNSSKDDKYHFIINIAKDGQKAYDEIINDKYDFVIFEEYLPNKKATEIMKLLNKSHIHINSVIITNDGSEELVLQAFRLGFKNYWRKQDLDLDYLTDEIINSYIASINTDEKETAAAEKKNKYIFFNFLFENSSKFDITFTREKLDEYYNGIRVFIERKVNEYNGEIRVRNANNFLIIFNSADEYIEDPILCAIEIFAGISMFNLSINETIHKINYKIGLHYGEINNDTNDNIVSGDLNFSVHMLQFISGYHFIISDDVYNKLIRKFKYRFSEITEFENHKIYQINY